MEAKLRKICDEAHRNNPVNLERVVDLMRDRWGMKYKDIAELFVEMKAVEDAAEFEELMQEIEHHNQWRR
tara:strand:- start:567 stop:776 length:210 start_codon:yes stop_codon:yes gene_type:complete